MTCRTEFALRLVKPGSFTHDHPWYRDAPILMGVGVPVLPGVALRYLPSAESDFCRHCRHLMLMANAVSLLLFLRHSSITRRGDPSAFRRREETPPFFLPVRLKPSGQWSTFCNWH